MSEELTRSLTTLAERGTPRGSGAVLEAASRDAAGAPSRRVSMRPAWAGVAAFAGTILLVGGSLVVGRLALGRPSLDAGSGALPDAAGDATAAVSSAWLPLVAAIGVTAAVVAAFIARTRHSRMKETAMATTLERSAEKITARDEGRRRLVITAVVLAVALVALAAWVIFDRASEPSTAAPEEVVALYDEYNEAWAAADADAFRELTTFDYVFRSSYSSGPAYRTSDQILDRDEQAAVIFFSSPGDVTVETLADLVVVRGSNEYFVSAQEELTVDGQTLVGITAIRMRTDEGVLKVAEHNWVGGLP